MWTCSSRWVNNLSTLKNLHWWPRSDHGKKPNFVFYTQLQLLHGDQVLTSTAACVDNNLSTFFTFSLTIMVQGGYPQPELVEDKPQIGALSIKLLPFWPADPIIWFAQAEAQFLTRGIKREDTKVCPHYRFLTAEDNSKRFAILSFRHQKTLLNYATLKEQLIKCTSASEQKRVQMLLTEEELGDKKPSQPLWRMRQLLGECKLEDSILKQLFVQCLLSNAQLILASSSDTVSI